MKETSPVGVDLGLSAFLIAAAGLFIRDGWHLPPGSFEPLGPAPVPRAIALFVILLSLVVIVQAAARLRAGAEGPPPPPYVRCRLMAGAFFGLTVGYVAVMAFGLVGYAMATTGFVTLSILLLEQFRLRSLPLALVVGLVLGVGLRYVFTQVFVVDLP